MKEFVFKIVRKNKRIYYFCLELYDFIRPIYKKTFGRLETKQILDKKIKYISKTAQDTGLKELQIHKGKPYFKFQNVWFEYISEDEGGSLHITKDEKEYKTWLLLKEKIKKNSTIIDAGANIGYFTILAAKNILGSKIYSFEPVPKTREHLINNVFINKIDNQVKIEGIALTDKNGYLMITTNKGGRNHITKNNSLATKVLATRLDTYCEKNNIKKIDFIKCDIEGAELFFLRGAEKIINTQKPKIVLEIQETWTKRFNYEAKEIFDFLKSKNYIYQIITDKGLIKGSDYKKIRQDLLKSNNFYFEKK